ncbi:Progranulin like protein [Argiope bruennichi]|uniref:Progranulin like protein n=1 Tax=Argiope bruennichi TaxID=94029 RepID=A0A8T0FP31_ARGBR|nr:Progranulin like protein [Argiope bruennichi]
MKMLCLAILVLVSSVVAVLSEGCSQGTCKSDETCCATSIPGGYSCCPYENAVCCPGGARCCPQGTVCDVPSGSCRPKMQRQQSKLLNFDDLVKRQGDAVTVSSDDCKPGTCSSDETCCPTAILGDYSCCPYVNAVCCKGHAFCCPEGTECDLVEEKCIFNDEIEESEFEKRQGDLDEESTDKKQCADGSLCSSDNTCCVVAGGKYGCCPHLNGVCCPDKIHCCPQGEKCDVTSHYCVKKEMVHHSSVREQASSVYSEDSA